MRHLHLRPACFWSTVLALPLALLACGSSEADEAPPFQATFPEFSGGRAQPGDAEGGGDTGSASPGEPGAPGESVDEGQGLPPVASDPNAGDGNRRRWLSG